MLLVTPTSRALGNQRQVHVNGHDYTLNEYIGAMPLRGRYVDGNEQNDNGLPQGFLVHQPPGAVTPPHFHETNQFQVFVEGSGRMGKQVATPLTVQYANGHTPYGPIEAGANGVRYFTLRQRWDPGAKYMPQSRDKLRKGNQRTRIKADMPVADDALRRSRTDILVDTVFAPEDDGLAACLYRLGPRGHAVLPDPVGGGGQYLIVAGGAMLVDGATLDRWSTLYLTDDEPAVGATAGEDGLDLLVLQFPRLN